MVNGAALVPKPCYRIAPMARSLTKHPARLAAVAAGQNHFFTGEPCIRGHVAGRYVRAAMGCVECLRLKNAANNPLRDLSGPRKLSEAQRVIMRDCTRASVAASRGYAPAPLERDCPPKPSDGRCDCCLSLVTGTGKRGFMLDHDHATGAFRGWTCDACNRGGGIVDNPERLRTRADFLECRLPWQ